MFNPTDDEYFEGYNMPGYNGDDDEDEEGEDGVDNEDNFGDDDDNPDGYGKDPEPEDEDSLNDDEEDKPRKPKNNDKEGNGAENVEVKGSVSGKGRPDFVKMNRTARSYHCGERTHKTCPFCKQKSIYREPVGSTIIRGAIWECLGMDRGVRYVCLNPRCKACFKPGSPKARFKDGATGRLATTHGFSTPDNPFSIRPQK